ncbi:hypothetical protein [Sphingomonas abietis]|uniref:UrcA family protein n=1 Tax=Sphingomonas abietis TaxID=3012344 RepID=A0ABY7NR37_9SPHN|nr:hypothetical protein [Sphingomonas abietis]WBO22906.1 hypothetical protein PBT88_01805 [Sphingomonas abietis]
MSIALAQATIQASPAAQLDPQEDIVVTARRLSRVRWSYEAKNGVLTRCTIKRSSGSAVIDKMVCDASSQCAAEHPNQGSWRLAPCIKDRVKEQFAAYRAQKEAS